MEQFLTKQKERDVLYKLYAHYQAELYPIVGLNGMFNENTVSS